MPHKLWIVCIILFMTAQLAIGGDIDCLPDDPPPTPRQEPTPIINNNGGAGGNGYGYGGNGYGGNGYGGAANVSVYGGKYEELRDMAAVVAGSVTTALRFKEGAHSTTTDSRVMAIDDILDFMNELEYQECKRGKGTEGDVKILDGLIRSQFYKTEAITIHKSMAGFDKSKYRFMGFLTGIAGVNDATMENVVYGIGQTAMEHGATDLVKVKESATEWGDTTGYAFDFGGFVTSIIGGAGSRAIGPGGHGTAGINGMKGGSADRADCKFAVFVSNERLAQVAAMPK